jgi:ankyrin repeat protein
VRPFQISQRSFIGFCLKVPFSVVLLTGCTTTLNKAITRDHPKQIDSFLASGADVNQADKDGATPLINAAQNGDYSLIRKLVERGAKVNSTDHEGYSALMYLAAGDTYKNEAVDYLLHNGARTDLWNSDGETVLMIAAKRECEPANTEAQTKLISLLLASGANPNDETRTGQRALHLAAFAGQPGPSLELLLRATAEPSLLNRMRLSALSEAARGDQLKAEAFLIGYGLQPQNLSSAPPSKIEWPPQIDPSFPVNARSCDAYGDYMMAHGNANAALENYKVSFGEYGLAVAEYRIAVDRYTAALQAEKHARSNRIVSTVLVDTLGVGVAATTGVGFFLIPKRVPNNIDEYEDELDRDQKELKSLMSEEELLAAKVTRALDANAPHSN